MEELISIIVPVYNTELYLEECLSSIQKQTYKNLEIIVVDDGSSDKSGVICDLFAEKDKRFKVFHQENKGQATARNTGLKKATGKYIGFVDSDDYIEQEMFEELYHAAQSSGAFIVMCGYEIFGKKSKEYLANFDELEKDEATKALAQERIVHSYLVDKLFLRSLFGDIKFPDGKQYEDYAVMHLLFLKTNKVKMIGRVLYHYRFRDGSTTRTTSGKKSRDFVEALEKRCNDLRNTPFYGAARNNQMIMVRGILLDLMTEGENGSSYYKTLRWKIEEIIVKEEVLLDKRQVLRTKAFLTYPELYHRIWLLNNSLRGNQR